MRKYMISKSFKFDAAHMIKDHFGKCRNLHGHTYELLIYLRAPKIDDKTGVLIDYYYLNEVAKKLVEEYDHSFLCNILDEKQIQLANILKNNNMKIKSFMEQTTAENLAYIIYVELKYRLNIAIKQEYLSIPHNDFDLKIIVKETANTSAEYGDF